MSKSINHPRWTNQVYTEGFEYFEDPYKSSGLYGIGVVLHDENGRWFGVVDLMKDKWKELATEDARRAYIETVTP